MYATWTVAGNDCRVKKAMLRFVSRLHGGLSNRLIRLGSWLMLGRNREVRLLDARRARNSTVLIDGILGLSGVLLGISLESLGCGTGAFGSKIPKLGCLLVGDAVTLLELSIDEFLVRDVDERAHEGGYGGNKSQAPERDELDEGVGDQGSKESLDEQN